MITEQNILPLFSVPLCRVNLGEPSPELVQQIQHQTWTLTRPSTHNSEDLHVLNQLPALREQIHQHLSEFVQVLGFDPQQYPFEFTTSWVNRADPQAEAVAHHHSNSMISGVYYPHTCDPHSSIWFHRADQYHNLWSDMVNVPTQRFTLFNSRQIQVTPSAGDLIMWPSHLIHSVGRNTTPQPRYSVAFNTFVRGVLDEKGGSELHL
jgi:uncharacterized protein (TIGR02466 family)